MQYMKLAKKSSAKESAAGAPDSVLTDHAGRRRRYPQSFLRFLMLSFALVTAPLVISLVRLTIEFPELALRSQAAIQRVTWVIQDVQSLDQLTMQMERQVLRAVALAEPTPVEEFAPLYAQFEQTSLGLLQNELPAAMSEELRALIGDGKALREQVFSQAVLSAPPDEMARMGRSIDALAGAGIAAASQEVQTLRSMMKQAQRETYLTFAIAVIVALLLTAAFTVSLARPVRHIESAIRRLGAGRLDEPILIGGPQDVRMLGERLDWLRRRLKELESDRELLSQSISHDLKTPLTSIHEGNDLLMQGVAGPLNPRQFEIAQIMQRSVKAMAQKIETLMTVGSSALRDAPVALRRVELSALIHQVVADHLLFARAKSVAIEVVGPAMSISGDRVKLRIVFDNLLSNAIRYSPTGGIVMFELQTQDDTAIVAVNDEGQGVPPASALRVFDPGYRALAAPGSPEAAPRGAAGSGMGLSIAREFVLAHGGQIELDPNGSRLPRRGARFVVRLPGLIHPGDGGYPPSGSDAATL